ncbi:hypothetical protein RRG08_043805 [Elysia crispata]|uniref:Uncharacterized protein n=1 Tax=Elysia crispata TaxID=231223 RepID=A0AAE0Z4F5_9GAST|nr:hypothetical protein RRG08_043805 [Elysia crispata]
MPGDCSNKVDVSDNNRNKSHHQVDRLELLPARGGVRLLKGGTQLPQREALTEASGEARYRGGHRRIDELGDPGFRFPRRSPREPCSKMASILMLIKQDQHMRPKLVVPSRGFHWRSRAGSGWTNLRSFRRTLSKDRRAEAEKYDRKL